MGAPGFIADVMLGRLARWLRLVGCDVLYDRLGEDSALLARALLEGRILLTRDVTLAKRAGENGYFVQTEGFRAQFAEIVRNFGIAPDLKSEFCPECGGRTVEVSRESVEGEVPEYTLQTHEAFRRCTNCGKIYWEGSHKQLATAELEKILSCKQ